MNCYTPRFSRTVTPPPDAPPDEELIARICRHDETALEAIYVRYQRLIFSIGLRITGDQAASEEIVQDTFQAVWQSAGSFQPNRNFTAWLVSIARHRAIDATRTRTFRSHGRETSLDDQPLAIGGNDAETLVLRIELRRALATLPAAQREAIILAFFGGLTHVEIAAHTSTPIGTIKSRMHTGMARLREVIGSQR